MVAPFPSECHLFIKLLVLSLVSQIDYRIALYCLENHLSPICMSTDIAYPEYVDYVGSVWRNPRITD